MHEKIKDKQCDHCYNCTARRDALKKHLESRRNIFEVSTELSVGGAKRDVEKIPKLSIDHNKFGVGLSSGKLGPDEFRHLLLVISH